MHKRVVKNETLLQDPISISCPWFFSFLFFFQRLSKDHSSLCCKTRMLLSYFLSPELVSRVWSGMHVSMLTALSPGFAGVRQSLTAISQVFIISIHPQPTSPVLSTSSGSQVLWLWDGCWERQHMGSRFLSWSLVQCDKGEWVLENMGPVHLWRKSTLN